MSVLKTYAFSWPILCTALALSLFPHIQCRQDEGGASYPSRFIVTLRPEVVVKCSIAWLQYSPWIQNSRSPVVAAILEPLGSTSWRVKHILQDPWGLHNSSSRCFLRSIVVLGSLRGHLLNPKLHAHRGRFSFFIPYCQANDADSRLIIFGQIP
jgi:hypothetical protein